MRRPRLPLAALAAIVAAPVLVAGAGLGVTRIVEPPSAVTQLAAPAGATTLIASLSKAPRLSKTPRRAHRSGSHRAKRGAGRAGQTRPTPEEPQLTPLVEDLTWISAETGWALVDEEGCGRPLCTAVLKTADGGATWTPLAWIPACASQCSYDVAEVTHLRFANADDGYAFGPDLFVTTDGGETWSPESGPYVLALEPAGSDVLRVSFSSSGCPGPCDLRIEQATAGSDVWRTLDGPFQGDAVQLVRQGLSDADVAIFENPAGGAGSAHGTLLTSVDGGWQWQTRPDPCGTVGGNEYDMVALAAAPGSVLGALCTERGGTGQFVAISTDGGSVFLPTLMVGAVKGKAEQFDQIAMTSASNLFLGTGGLYGTGRVEYQLISSTDGGSTWQVAIAASGEAQLNYPSGGFLGFENPSVGRWVGDPLSIWQTSDGGRTWTGDNSIGVSLPPP
jgi:hypothetical protein